MASISWENLNKLDSFAKLKTLKGAENGVSLKDVLSGAKGAKRVAEYQVPMAGGLTYNYAAKQVNKQILGVLKAFAKEAQLL